MNEEFLVWFPDSQQWKPLEDEFELYNKPVLSRPYNHPNDYGVGHVFNLEIDNEKYTLANCLISKEDQDNSDYRQDNKYWGFPTRLTPR